MYSALSMAAGTTSLVILGNPSFTWYTCILQMNIFLVFVRLFLKEANAFQFGTKQGPPFLWYSFNNLPD